MKVNRNRNIDELFDTLPDQERITAAILRELVKEHLPEAREKLSWGAPFYHGRRSICYIWPASIPWGKINEGVALGFTRADLINHDGYLGPDAGKKLGRHVYLSPEEIDVERITGLLLQAKAGDAEK